MEEGQGIPLSHLHLVLRLINISVTDLVLVSAVQLLSDMLKPDGSPLATVQRIFELRWDAIPFLNATGDSFQALTHDPADNIVSRAAIPAHVRLLLNKAVWRLAT